MVKARRSRQAGKMAAHLYQLAGSMGGSREDGRPRILILTASVGTGHLRAAEAVDLALRELAPEAFVKTVDVLSLSTGPFRYCYGQIYVALTPGPPQVPGVVLTLASTLPAARLQAAPPAR